jgi:hypothetical protein
MAKRFMQPLLGSADEADLPSYGDEEGLPEGFSSDRGGHAINA